MKEKIPYVAEKLHFLLWLLHNHYVVLFLYQLCSNYGLKKTSIVLNRKTMCREKVKEKQKENAKLNKEKDHKPWQY